MGFSVSGTMLILALGMFIAVGTFYGTITNAMELISDAQGDHIEDLDHVQNSDVAIQSVTVEDQASCDVNVTVENTGETDLDLNETDLLYDNAYETDWRRGSEIVTDSSTDVWLPGERLTIVTEGLSGGPERIKVVADPGVADTEVADISC